MKRVAAALAVLAILLAGGWFVLRQVAQGRLQDGIAQFRAGLGPDGAFTYATATAAPWRLGADFTDARVRRDGVVTTASQVALSRVGRHRIGRAVLRDVRLDGNGIGASAAMADISDLSLNGRAAPAQGDIWTGRMRARDIELHTSTGPAGSMRVASAALDQQHDGRDGFVQQAAFEGVSLDSGGTPVGSAARIAEHARWSASKRALADTDATGLWLPPASPLGQQLDRFGYQGARGIAHTSLRYDGQAGTMLIEPLTIRLDGIGMLTLSLGLDHLPLSDVPRADAMSMAQASLTVLTLRYDDAGLAGRVLGTMARRAGVTQAQYTAALTASLNGNLPNRNGQEAIRFLNDPQRFVVALHPPAPLSAASLLSLQGGASPDEVIRRLGFSFQAD